MDPGTFADVKQHNDVSKLSCIITDLLVPQSFSKSECSAGTSLIAQIKFNIFLE